MELKEFIEAHTKFDKLKEELQKTLKGSIIYMYDGCLNIEHFEKYTDEKITANVGGLMIKIDPRFRYLVESIQETVKSFLEDELALSPEDNIIGRNVYYLSQDSDIIGAGVVMEETKSLNEHSVKLDNAIKNEIILVDAENVFLTEEDAKNAVLEKMNKAFNELDNFYDMPSL